MLNVSCQKQKRCTSFPAESLTDSPMECVGQPRTSEACNLLDVPELSCLDVDDDDCEVVIGIRPKSSPLPRRKSSVSDDDSEPEPPLCGSRRVSFADAKGLSLVQVKEFETWDEPKLPRYEGEGKCTEKYFLSLQTFSLPLSTEELFSKVQDQKVELETIMLLPGTTILKGVIRVLNISFSKAVYVRTTLDGWSSHFDLLAEYVPGCSDGLMDSFSFKLTLVPPFREQGARVDFCLRYETPAGTFWANNNNRNYVLFCHHGMKDQKEKTQKENVNKKSCLKSVSQNFTEENLSAVEAPSQGNVSTVVSTKEEERNAVKIQQITDNQAETSEEVEQKIQAENEQSSSRRSRRRATRMARLRDYFAQRDGEADETGRDESPPEAKQPAKEENTELQSFSEASTESEGFQFVSETVEKRTDVLNGTLQADNYTWNSESEKSLTGGECTTDILDNPFNSNEEPDSAESQNISLKAEARNPEKGAIDECCSTIASEPADSVIPAVGSESLGSQANSVTFGTVVAPLYGQVFGRMGIENQSVDDSVNPEWAAQNVRNITQSYYHTEIRENSSTDGIDTTGNNDRIQEEKMESQESNQEHSDAVEEEGEEEEEKRTNFNVMGNDTLGHKVSLQDPVEILHSDESYTNMFQPKAVSGDTEAHPPVGNILNMDLGNAQVPKESLYPHEEAQTEDVTFDLQSQAAETTPAQLSEQKCLEIKMNSHEIHTNTNQMQTQEVTASVETDETDQHNSMSKEIDKTATISPTGVISEEDKSALHDFNSNFTDNLVTKETANSSICCCEIVNENDFSTQETLLEARDESNDAEQQNKLNNLTEDETEHCENEVCDELTESSTDVNHTCGGDTDDMELRNEEVIVSEKGEHFKIEAAASREEDFCFSEPNKVKNWEIIVEEETNYILNDEKENKAIYLKDTEAEEGQGEQLGETGIETASENRDTKERGKEKLDEARAEEITDPGKKENTTEDADVLEVKHSIVEEKIGHIVAGKNRDFEKKIEYAESTQMETIAGEDESEGEKIEEQEEEAKHFTEMLEVNTQRKNGEKTEKIKIGLKAGAVWEDQEEHVQKEMQNYKGKMLDEGGEAEIVGAVSGAMTLDDTEDELGCFEERLDITQNVLEDGLSALVNNSQVRDNENTGEGRHAHVPTEMHLHNEEDLEINKEVTGERSKAKSECAAAEGRLCVSTDEPESDQTSQSSASAESDSDDEVELYMHCLRAVHTGTQAAKDRNKDAASAVSRRPRVSRGKHVSTPMPSISESLDEEPHLSCPQERITRKVPWWKKTCSCGNVSKTLLNAALLVAFLVVAYHYDFLACFGLYLVSVVWLCCHEETQPVKDNNRIG
ncbi:hypothetical protein Q5P01_012771 [Channa striata]|uniref:CBM21 domain-containing protein n=1 Tax=Channa striata TaxID=64152 RepID=A0AA88SKM5_CHASR|nr:hypothetical protein Q5P01_012771 [Channa striata]